MDSKLKCVFEMPVENNATSGDIHMEETLPAEDKIKRATETKISSKVIFSISNLITAKRRKVMPIKIIFFFCFLVGFRIFPRTGESFFRYEKFKNGRKQFTTRKC